MQQHQWIIETKCYLNKGNHKMCTLDYHFYDLQTKKSNSILFRPKYICDKTTGGGGQGKDKHKFQNSGTFWVIERQRNGTQKGHTGRCNIIHNVLKLGLG